MSTQSNILREYLVTLGFQINKTEKRRIDSTIGLLDKRMLKLGSSVIGAASAFVTMGVAFANSMQKMYYNARYAGTTIENLEGMEFGAQRVGLSAGKATALLKGFTAAIRGNPGLEGFLNANGVQTAGRDMKDVFNDFIAMTKRFPTFIGNKIGEMFGIGPEDLFNLQHGLDKMKAQEELRAKWAKEMGVNADDAQKASEALSDKWAEIVERGKLFSQYLLFATQKPLTDALNITAEMLKNMVGIVKQWEQIVQMDPEVFKDKMIDGLRSMIGLGPMGHEPAKLNDATRRRLGDDPDVWYHAPEGNRGLGRLLERYLTWRSARGRAQRGEPDPTDPAAIEAASDPGIVGGTTPRRLLGAPTDADPALMNEREAYLASIEKKWGLPQGLLDRVWRRESARGKAMLSPKGAMGHFGFMPDTGKAYGINGMGDAMNFQKSADASGHLWADLLKQYGGDLELAAAAYNWGSGKMQKFGLGAMPKETRDYVKDVAGSYTLNQDINIRVDGSQSPEATAKAIAKEQRSIGADLLRNFRTPVR